MLPSARHSCARCLSVRRPSIRRSSCRCPSLFVLAGLFSYTFSMQVCTVSYSDFCVIFSEKQYFHSTYVQTLAGNLCCCRRWALQWGRRCGVRSIWSWPPPSTSSSSRGSGTSSTPYSGSRSVPHRGQIVLHVGFYSISVYKQVFMSFSCLFRMLLLNVSTSHSINKHLQC